MTRLSANFEFVIGAVDVNVAVIGVGVARLFSGEAEDAGEDEVVGKLFTLPLADGLAGFEDGADGRAGAVLVLHDEVAERGLIAALGEADAELGSRAWPVLQQTLAVPELEALGGDGNFNAETRRLHVVKGALDCDPFLPQHPS